MGWACREEETVTASAEGADRWDAEGVREDMKLEREEDAEDERVTWTQMMGWGPKTSVSKIILNVV